MLNLELIKNLLIISVASSVITTSLVQKIKESFTFKKSSCIIIVSFVVSMIFGTLFALTFSEAKMVESLWVGLFSFVGADTLYKAFEDKIFKSFANIIDDKKNVINEKNIIK